MDLITFDEGEIAFDETNFTEGEANGEPWLETPARLFRTGKHKGRNYTEADLDKMGASVTEPAGNAGWNVPVQLDHNHSARNTAGHLRKAFREGSVLRGVLRFCGSEAVKGVKAGNFTRLSISHRPDMSLHHVAVTPFPYLLDSAVGFSGLTLMDPGVADAIKQIAASLQLPPQDNQPSQDKPEEDKPVAEDAKKQAESPPETTSTTATDKAENTKEAAPAASFTSIDELTRDFNEKTAAQQAQIDALLAKQAEQEQAMRFTELAGIVNEFSEAGKTLPVMRDAELALVQSFSDEQLELYRAYKDSQPALVDYAVRGMQTSCKPGDGAGQSDAEDGASAARARQQSKGGK